MENPEELKDELKAYHRERGLILGDIEISVIVNDRIEQGKWIINEEGFLQEL